MNTKEKRVIIIVLTAAIIFAGIAALLLSGGGGALASGGSAPEELLSYAEQMTESQNFAWGNGTYTISDYGADINPENSGAGYQLFRTTSGVATTVIPSGRQHDLSVTGDDPIVKIIPKDAFRTRGEHFYWGNGYGFYVKTFSNAHTSNASTVNNMSIVLVFTVERTLDPVMETITMEAKISFQYDYAYIKGTESTVYAPHQDNFGKTYNSVSVNYSVASGSDYVVPMPTLFAPAQNYTDTFYRMREDNVLLKDFTSSIQLTNIQEPDYEVDSNGNQISNGYIATADRGVFLTKTSYSAVGKELNTGVLNHNATISARHLVNLAKLVVGVGSIDKLGSPLALSDFRDGVWNIVQDARNTTSINVADERYVEAYAANASSQAQLYGRLMKAAGTMTLTGHADSLWIHTGGYAKSVYNYDMPDDYDAKYMRADLQAIVGIALYDINIPNVTSNDAQDRAGTYYIKDYIEYINEPVYKGLSLSETKTAHLIPNETDYLSFTPAYGSNYTFTASNVTASLACSITDVNGNAVSVTKVGNTFTAKLTGGTNYHIRLGGNSGNYAICPTVSVAPASIGGGAVTLAANEYYLFGFNSLAGVRALTLSNTNCEIVKLYNADFEEISLICGRNWSAASALQLPMQSGKYYAVVRNKTASGANFTFTQSEVSTELPTGTITLGNNYAFYRIDLSAGENLLDMSFSASFNRILLKADGTEQAMFGSTSYCYFNVSTSTTMWLGLIKNTTASTTGTVKVENWGQSLFAWEINGLRYIGSGHVVPLEIEVYHSIKLKVGNDYAPGTSLGTDTRTKAVTHDREDDTIIILEAYFLHTPAEDSFEVEAYGFASTAVKIIIEPFLNTITVSKTSASAPEDMVFKWTKSSPTTITGFTYRLEEIDYDVTASGPSGTVNFSSHFALAKNATNITIMRYKTPLRGWVNITDNRPQVEINTRYYGGSGTSSNPFLITTTRHFNNISQTNTASTYFKQQTNLSFTSSVQPMQSVTFRGNYDGSINNSIYGLQIKATGQGGLFKINEGSIGRIATVMVNCSGNYAEIGGIVYENKGRIYTILDIDGTLDVSSGSLTQAGGVAYKNYSGKTIESCHSFLTIKVVGMAAGIAVENEGIIKNCTYDGGLGASNAGSAAGIAVWNYSQITGCTNYGYIGQHASSLGGGIVSVNGANGIIDNCKNYGSVRVGTGGGGIASINFSGGTIKNSKTMSSVTISLYLAGSGTGYYLGGIVGITSGSVTSCTVDNSVNIKYTGPSTSDKTFAPWIAYIAGGKEGGTVSGCSGTPTLSSGNLAKVKKGLFTYHYQYENVVARQVGLNG